jgi:hypothetical protein
MRVREVHRRRGSSGGGHGATIGAPIGDTACEGKRMRGSLGVCEGGCGGALGALI